MQSHSDESHRTFTVDRCLGRGGFGEVYRARMRHPSGLETEVALKVLRRDVPPDSQAVLRLRDEAMHLSRVQHPGILRVHDLTILAGRACLVTEYVEGQDLSTCIVAPDAMGLRALLQVVSDVAGALHAAYHAEERGGEGPLRIVHRDVKPSNIRVGIAGQVKLLDFGIARTDELTREARTGTDMMVGSPKYMAPERFRSATPEPASDVYSLGVVLWEGIARRRMFDVPLTVLASLAIDKGRFDAHVTERLEEIRGYAPATVLRLVADMLSYDVDARPSPAGITRRCDDLIDSLEGQPTLRAWTREHPWPIPKDLGGELEGQQLTEGRAADVTTDPRLAARDMAVAAPQTDPAPRMSAGRRSAVWLRALGVATLLGSALAALTVPAVWQAWGGDPVVQAQVAPAGAKPREENPEVDPPADPSRAGASRADPPIGVPRPQLAPRVEPGPPAPQPVPRVYITPIQPAPRAAGAGRVRAVGDASIALRRDGREIVIEPGPGRQVPVGSWDVFGRWDRGMGSAPDLRIDVRAVDSTEVRCTKAMQTCSAATP